MNHAVVMAGGSGTRFWPESRVSRSKQFLDLTGGGPMVAFEIKGDKQPAFRFLNALEIFRISNNLGDAKSLAIQPATTTHSQLDEAQQRLGGITPELVRLSVGLEHIDDILADLDQALAATK